MEKNIERPLTDEEVIEQSLNDPSRYQIIMERYTFKLQRYARLKFFVSREDAEDIAQEALIRGYVGIHRFDRKQKWSSWIYKIASNVGCNYLRKNKYNQILENTLCTSIEVVMEDQLDYEMQEKNLRNCLQDLEDLDRQILDLYYFGNLNQKEICKSLEISSNKFKLIFARAKKQFWSNFKSSSS